MDAQTMYVRLNKTNEMLKYIREVDLMRFTCFLDHTDKAVIARHFKIGANLFARIGHKRAGPFVANVRRHIQSHSGLKELERFSQRTAIKGGSNRKTRLGIVFFAALALIGMGWIMFSLKQTKLQKAHQKMLCRIKQHYDVYTKSKPRDLTTERLLSFWTEERTKEYCEKYIADNIGGHLKGTDKALPKPTSIEQLYDIIADVPKALPGSDDTCRPIEEPCTAADSGINKIPEFWCDDAITHIIEIYEKHSIQS
jgi:hypothetical protein